MQTSTKGREGVRRLNGTASASAWYIGSNIIARATAFLFTPIFTRLLSPAEYGIYSLYTSLMGFFTVLTTFQMSGNVLYRGFARFGAKDSNRFLCSALGALTLTSGASVILFAIIGNGLSPLLSVSTPLLILLTVQIYLTSLEGFYLAKCRYDGKYRTVAALNIAVGIITPTLALALIKAGLGGYSRIISPLLISLAVAIPIAVKIIRSGKRLVWGEGWRFIFKMTLPMLPHFIATSVIAQGDKIILARTLGDEVLGKYGAAYAIGFIPSQLTGALLVALSPWIIRKMKSGDGGAVRDAVSTSARVIGYATLIFLAVLPELFYAAVAPEYREALPVAYAVALSVIFSFLASAISICILHYEKPMLITKNSLITALPSVLLTYLFIRKFGYIGGALSSLFAYVMLFLLNRTAIVRVAGKDARVKFALPLTAFFLFAVLIFLLRFSPLSRLLIAMAIALLALPEVKKCKALLF